VLLTAQPQVTQDTVTLIGCPACARLNDPSRGSCASCGQDMRGLGAASDTFPKTEDQVIPGDGDVGRLIDGRYRILSRIGEGGMGSVYRAQHVRMGKIIALKLMHPDVARKRNAVERFRREAQAVSKLDHPNIISVFDSGECEDGLYLVMEYVPGRDLATILRDEGPLDEPRALRITMQVLEAMREAHDAGIIHRDIKAGNIMLSRTRGPDERVKVLDFGIAKLVSSRRQIGNDEAGKLTANADLVGTPNCMSPEQIRGVELDARSDLYSVAALLFELLSGRGPFEGTAFEVLSQHLVCPPPSIRSIRAEGEFSDQVEAILERGLAKNPEDRFQSAAEMQAALGRTLEAPLVAHPHDASIDIARREDWDAFERSFRRRRAAVHACGLCALGVVLALCVAAGKSDPLPPPMPVGVLEEIEPNDLPSQANFIEPGRPVSGRIGPAPHAAISDRDFFELFVKRESVLSAELSGVRGLNLVLELFADPPLGASELPLVAAVDDGRVSEPEQLNDVVLRPGRYYLRLMERRRLDEPDGGPRSSASEWYTLKIALEGARPFQELEPNNLASSAMPVSVDHPVLGKTGPAASVDITRSGPEPLPAWSIDLYRARLEPSQRTACAVIASPRHAAIRLVAPGRKPVRAAGGAANGVCAKGAESSALFEVNVELGGRGDETYPIAFIGEQPGGFAGLFALAARLSDEGRRERALALIERSLELVPRAADAALAKSLLRAESFAPR
jgi:eukaryotic-like serine/threonine-protein kinase